MSDNKIIKFPVEKVKNKKGKKTSATKLQQSDSLKKAAPVTMFTILCIYLFSNTMLMSNSEKKIESRAIASLGQFSEYQRDIAWEHQLAQQLASKPLKRGIASVGSSPKLQEELTAELLHSKYRIKFSSGKIVNIELTDTIDQVTPTYIDGHKFLTSYRQLLPINFVNAKMSSKIHENNKVHEIYNLIDSNNNVIGNVKFELDQYGRLLAMKVQNPS